jgi:RNA polymerase sigma factor (sigma-70 family)
MRETARLGPAGMEVHEAASPPVAFEEFFQQEGDGLYRVLWLVTRSRFEAEELTQEAFVRVLERWDRVSEMEDPHAYLYRTAMNAFRTSYGRALLAAKRTMRVLPTDDTIAEIEERDAAVVDLFDAPVGVAWGYAAPTDLTLTAYTKKTEHAAATEHLCPTKPERDTAIRIDGTPARFLLMHCPATDGILVLLGITVHDGTAFTFAFQGPPGNRATENEEGAEFLRLLAGVRL